MMIKTKLDFKLKNIQSGKEFNLDKVSATIGRDADCDILLDQGNPSRIHAQLILKNGKLLVDDLNSTNGTFVNNQRIFKTTQLHPGDIIRFSTSEFTLLSNTAGDKTIISKKPPFVQTENSYIVLNEITVDPNETALQQGYPLPFGWPADDTISKKLFQAKPDKKSLDKIDQQIQMSLAKDDTVYIAALIFNPNAEVPTIFGLSLDSQQHTLSIGRNKDCTFTLNAPSVSEHHADLSFEHNKWHLKDCNSTNGIREHRNLISELKLEHNTTVSLGQIKMTFRKVPWVL